MVLTNQLVERIVCFGIVCVQQIVTLTGLTHAQNGSYSLDCVLKIGPAIITVHMCLCRSLVPGLGL